MNESSSGAAVADAPTRGGEVDLQGFAGKYLTFKLGAEAYGLEILKVSEIIGVMEMTRIPKTPAFVRGVVNLRGKVIPVIDLRLRFGMDGKEMTERTCTVVLQVTTNGTASTMGILVDEVSEVIDIAADQLESTPSFGGRIDTRLLLGMAKVGEKVVMLLDTAKVVSLDEIDRVGETIGTCQIFAKEKEDASRV